MKIIVVFYIMDYFDLINHILCEGGDSVDVSLDKGAGAGAGARGTAIYKNCWLACPEESTLEREWIAKND